MKAFSCCLVTKDENGVSQLNEEFTGRAINEHLLPVPDETSSTGIRIQPMISVLWDDHRSPSPSYHSPEELHWLAVPELDVLEELDDEDEEDEDDFQQVPYVQAEL